MNRNLDNRSLERLFDKNEVSSRTMDANDELTPKRNNYITQIYEYWLRLALPHRTFTGIPPGPPKFFFVTSGNAQI